MKKKSCRCPWPTAFGRFVWIFGVERLARELGVTPSAVYQWMRGAWRPRTERLVRIQRIALRRRLKFSVEDILRDLRSQELLRKE